MTLRIEFIYPDRFTTIEDAIINIDSPSLLGYHTPAYMSALTEVLHDNPLYIVAYCEKEVAGFLPLRWRDGKWGPVINSLPFFGPNGGPVLAPYGVLSEDNIIEPLFGALLEFANNLDAISVAIYTPFLSDPKTISLAFKPGRVIERFTQYIKIADSQLLWPKRASRAIARAKKKHCAVRLGTPEDLNELLDMYRENCEFANIPVKPPEYFDLIVNSLCPAGVARFTVAESGCTAVAMLITIQSGKTINYNVPCSRIKNRTLQANSLLIDEAIHHFQAMGYRYWNWESSPSRQHPVYEFKKNWGSFEAPYYILVRFPRGLKPFANRNVEDISSAYPYYYVIPFDELER